MSICELHRMTTPPPLPRPRTQDALRGLHNGAPAAGRARSRLALRRMAGRYSFPAMWRRTLIVLLALGMLLPVACGDGEGGSGTAPRRLSAEEEAAVDRARTAIRSYCRQVGRHLAGGRPPTAGETRTANDAVDSLVSLAREDPEARYRGEETIRLVLGDTAEDLEGTNCSPDLVARLERGLASLPRPE
jgi:hypothetical protein